MKRTFVLLLFFKFMAASHLLAQQVIDIIPKPQSMQVTKGVFKFTPATTLFLSQSLSSKAKLFKQYLEPALGFDLTVSSKAASNSVVEFKLDKALAFLGEEGYQLDINPNKITVSAFNEMGICWGIQTIRQLLPEQILREARVRGVSWEIPCMEITDKPRFKWRGLMLDCSRTFIPKEQLKKYVETMSFFKMNVLHLHLTDDQGWRLEIKKYPKLTSICAKFDSTFHEQKENEGFYSQDDMRELIQFAAGKNVQIVPEIEMPGHTTEVFAAFPQLSCKGDTLKVRPWSKEIGVRKDVFCAGNEETFEFLENVLDEVAALFPSEFIHIGGDEAPKQFWKECTKCQQRIKENGLKDEHELQSWFVKRIEKYINSKGKKLIGWDEIMQGGLSETATVMYWRSWVKEVARKIPTISNNMIMSPTAYAYFDSPNEKTTLEKVYTVNPVPKEMSEENIHKVLGVQANFWSHLDRTAPKIERMLFPRLLAMSEIGWTNNNKKDWNDFKQRQQARMTSFDIMGVYYFVEKK